MMKRRLLRFWILSTAAATALFLSACAGLWDKKDPEAIVYATPELEQQFTQERFIRQASKLDSLSYTMEGTDPKDKSKIIDRVSLLRKPAVIRIDMESHGDTLSVLHFADKKVYLKNGIQPWHEVGGSQLSGSMALRYDLLMTPLKAFRGVKGNVNPKGSRSYELLLTPKYGLYTETLTVETDPAGNVTRCQEILASGRSMKNTEFKDYKDVNGLAFPEKVIIVLDPDGKGARTFEFKVTQCKVNEPQPAILFERPVTEDQQTPDKVQEKKSEAKPQALPAGNIPSNDKQTIQHKTGTEKP